MLAAGIDLGGSSVKAWVAEVGGAERGAAVVGEAMVPSPTLRPHHHRAELDPSTWWQAARRALGTAVAKAGRPAGDYVGVTATSLRQGFVLTDGVDELGPGLLNSDRRGAGQLDRLRRDIGVVELYRTTGHWPAPELTLPKLLHLAATDPRWAATRRVLFVHDWALWRLSGTESTEVSFASAGQMADVGRRCWAADVLDGLGLGTDRLAPLVEAGTVVGRLTDPDLGLPVGLPVVAGGGDTQMAAMGAGGLDDGVVTVVAGSSTPVQASVATPPHDPRRHPWVSTHLAPERWAVETNAGYPGTMLGWLATRSRCGPGALWELAAQSRPGANGVTAVVAAPVWSEEAWATKAPNAVLGITPATTDADLARAFVEAHAFAVRANVADLERVLDRRATTLVVTGGGSHRAGADPGSAGLPRLVADVLGRDVNVPRAPQPAALAGATLVARACGLAEGGARPDAVVVPAGDPRLFEEPYQRYLAAHAVLRAHLAEVDG